MEVERGSVWCAPSSVQCVAKLTEARLSGLQQGIVVNHTVRSTLDNDIHDSRCAVANRTLVQVYILCIYYAHIRSVPGYQIKVQVYL